MRQRDPRNVRDALLEAGHPPEEVEAMLAAAEAYRELERLKHIFDGAQGLRLEDFARRAQARALVALRLISDLADDISATAAYATAPCALDEWRDFARRYDFET
ncbi:MAG: hypothetical protein ACOZQL_10855 [Myxococcota bacterium]